MEKQILLFSLLLCGLLFPGCFPDDLSDLNGTLLEPAMEIPDYAFETADGRMVISDFEGKYVILAFGYTFCPDACPTTMARLAQTINLLEENADNVQVILLSVDPERDTPALLKSYTQTFNPDFIGASVADQDAEALYKKLGIYHEIAGSAENDSQESEKKQDYLIDHTTSTVVLDQMGNWRLVWNFELSPEEMASDLARLLRDR